MSCVKSHCFESSHGQITAWLAFIVFFFQVLMQAGQNARGVKLLASASLLPIYHWCVWEEDAVESFVDRHRIVWTAVFLMIDAQAV